jgi:hypothetical protein
MKRTALFCAVAGCVLLADVASLRGLPEGRWAHPSAQAPDARATAPTPPLGVRSSTPGGPARVPQRADSTRRSVPAGEVLITTLPERIAGRPVAAYNMLRTPALSNLAGRSFFWRTRPQDAGRHRLLFRARFDTTTTAPADTLVMHVTVE